MNNKNLILRNVLYANKEKMLVFIIEYAQLNNIMAQTRFGKSGIIFYNPMIVFSLTIA